MLFASSEKDAEIMGKTKALLLFEDDEEEILFALRSKIRFNSFRLWIT
jgi:hypothetical protein